MMDTSVVKPAPKEVKKIRAVTQELTLALPGSPAYKKTFYQDLYMSGLSMARDSARYLRKMQKEGHEVYTTSEDGTLSPAVLIQYEGEKQHPEAGAIAMFTVILRDLRPYSEKVFPQMVTALVKSMGGRKLQEAKVYCETDEEQRAIEEYILNGGEVEEGDHMVVTEALTDE